MKQLALGISPPPQPTLENFIPGANAELLARLRELKSGRFKEAVLYLWGEPGSGKTHLLRACGGRTVVDDVEKLAEPAQIELFNAINEARESGGQVLAAGNAPPAQLPLREDLRTRLAWGLVYEVKRLTDEERAVYLRAEAGRRGMRLPEDVIAYLLTHARRDLPTLTGILDRLDRASLEQKRQVTLPLAREILNFPEP
ncbi:MAG TPA: DnaA/Hda family protein [Burkholderiales bacterium]|nr:DnaA/Hda family protein [Burkholderiales bacterium]HEX2648749.1 DnaA/Hda family protein [Burkholderiales bacterium]